MKLSVYSKFISTKRLVLAEILKNLTEKPIGTSFA